VTKRRRTEPLGDHWFGPKGKASKGTGHPIMFGYPKAAEHFIAMPDGGGYPKRFIEWAYGIMQVSDAAKVLHLCSGSMRTGVRVDIRPEMEPDIVADCRNVPLPDESFDWILADPPYSIEYADNLYDTKSHYPKPNQIVKEAYRLLKPGGQFGLMHFQVPFPHKELKIKQVYGISTGCGYAIRAWTHMQKTLQMPLLEVEDETQSKD